MTTELEEQFFKVFLIEKKCVKGCGEYYSERNIDIWDLCKNKDCKKYKCHLDKSIWEYPEITADKLLALICILNTITTPDLGDINVGRLKLSILEQCIEVLKKVDWQNRTPTKEEYIDEVRALFGGEE